MLFHLFKTLSETEIWTYTRQKHNHKEGFASSLCLIILPAAVLQWRTFLPFWPVLVDCPVLTAPPPPEWVRFLRKNPGKVVRNSFQINETKSDMHLKHTYRSQQPVSGSPPLCRNGSDRVLSPPPARTPRLWTAAVCRRSRRSRPDGRHCLWLAVPSRWRRSAGHSGHTLYQTYCETEKGLGINTYPINNKTCYTCA